ncbi:hypothetical protein [Stomatobaculum longum]|uniref:hypothetical protein n=1 Tax=Stomatobaculum longum TaxID=796942 RepID=UPI00280383FD|nr:hypothetical protein [Stomatobaculum longum]
MEVCLTPLEMACIEESIGLAIKDTYALERLVWTFEKNLLPEIYRDNLKNWMLAVHFCGAYLHDRAALASEFPLIARELQEINAKNDLNLLRAKQALFEMEFYELEFYLKRMRIVILYHGKQDYVRVKLRTFLRAYGYQRRSAKLMTFLKQGMERYGLVSFLRGNQRCDIEEIRLDDMISFRVMKQ